MGFCPDCGGFAHNGKRFLMQDVQKLRRQLDAECADLTELAQARATFARQARTIRRLRALADGYRAKYKAEYEHHEVTLEEHGLDLRDAKREERARIVAELRARAKYLIDSYGKAQENAAYEIYDLADAIERGEL